VQGKEAYGRRELLLIILEVKLILVKERGFEGKTRSYPLLNNRKGKKRAVTGVGTKLSTAGRVENGCKLSTEVFLMPAGMQESRSGQKGRPFKTWSGQQLITRQELRKIVEVKEMNLSAFQEVILIEEGETVFGVSVTTYL